MDKMGAKVSLDLTLVKNKKDVIGSSWAEHDKLKITEEQLAAWHENIDQSYIVKANRTVLRMLHNAIFPNGRVNTRANQRLQHIVDTAGIHKIITVENTGDEGLWKADLWRTPAIQVWAKLLFKFEGCLLQEVTTSGKTQTFYEVDAKLDTLTLNIIQNFKDVSTFMNLFRASARQSMIKRLATHGTDKDVWRKTEDYISSFLHEDTMLTLDNTSEGIKRAQTYLDRDMTISATTTANPKS